MSSPFTRLRERRGFVRNRIFRVAPTPQELGCVTYFAANARRATLSLIF